MKTYRRWIIRYKHRVLVSEKYLPNFIELHSGDNPVLMGGNVFRVLTNQGPHLINEERELAFEQMRLRGVEFGYKRDKFVLENSDIAYTQESGSEWWFKIQQTNYRTWQPDDATLTMVKWQTEFKNEPDIYNTERWCLPHSKWGFLYFYTQKLGSFNGQPTYNLDIRGNYFPNQLQSFDLHLSNFWEPTDAKGLSSRCMCGKNEVSLGVSEACKEVNKNYQINTVVKDLRSHWRLIKQRNYNPKCLELFLKKIIDQALIESKQDFRIGETIPEDLYAL